MFEWLRSRKIYKDGVYTLQRLPNFMTLRLLCIASVVHERFLSVYLRVMVVKLVIKVCSVNRTIYIRLSHRRGFNLLEHVLPIWAWSKIQICAHHTKTCTSFPSNSSFPCSKFPKWPIISHILQSRERGSGWQRLHTLLVGTRAVSISYLEGHAVCSFAQCGWHFEYTECAYPTRIPKLNPKIRYCILIK